MEKRLLHAWEASTAMHAVLLYYASCIERYSEHPEPAKKVAKIRQTFTSLWRMTGGGGGEEGVVLG